MKIATSQARMPVFCWTPCRPTILEPQIHGSCVRPYRLFPRPFFLVQPTIKMVSTKRPILIVGATGSQGGALIRALLDAGATDTHELLAVTRNASSGSAKSLQERGVKIVQGDLNDVPGIFSAAKDLLGKDAPDIWGVYSVQVISSVRP